MKIADVDTTQNVRKKNIAIDRQHAPHAGNIKYALRIGLNAE